MDHLSRFPAFKTIVSGYPDKDSSPSFGLPTRSADVVFETIATHTLRKKIRLAILITPPPQGIILDGVAELKHHA